jgi:hypothetical protein
MASFKYTFNSGDTLTPARLNDARDVFDIVNADIKTDAAIAGTKIVPDFGSQNIRTTGNLGLAEAAPAARLTVSRLGGNITPAGTTTGMTALLHHGSPGGKNSPSHLNILCGSNATAGVVMGDEDNADQGWVLYNNNTDSMTFGTNGTGDRIRITSAGNIGINTTSPTERLEIAGNVKATSFLGNLTGSSASLSTGSGGAGDVWAGRLLTLKNFAPGVLFQDDSANQNNFLVTADSNALTVRTTPNEDGSSLTNIFSLSKSGDVTLVDKIVHSNDVDTAIRFPSNDTVTVETAGSERARITSTGLMGIAETAPAARLTVGRLGGSITPAGTTTGMTALLHHGSVGGVNSPSLLYIVSGNSAAAGIVMGDEGESSRGSITYDNNIDALRFSVNGTNDRLFIASNGDIGMSALPSSRLHVDGDITVSSATTATSATAGTNGNVPAQVAGYLVVSINGTSRKIPYYAT